MDNGYEQVAIAPDRVRFTVQPFRPASSPVGGIVIGGIVGALALVGTARWIVLPARLAVALLLATVVGRGLLRVRRWAEARRDRMRAPGGTFVASPSGIEVADRRITSGANLSVRNPLLGRARAGLVRCSYALYADATILAGGMTEAIALGLLADVRRVVRAGHRRA